MAVSHLFVAQVDGPKQVVFARCCSSFKLVFFLSS